MRPCAAGFVFALVSLGACRGDPARSSVIILLTDALRQDHLGIYGYARDTSPNIDAFAADSVVLENAIAQSSWTAPSVAALFTSEYPARLNPPKEANIQGIRTLAEWLSSNGYHTGAFVSNPLVTRSGGYAQGFDSFQYLKHARAFRIVNRAVTWIDEAAGTWYVSVRSAGSKLIYSPRARTYHYFDLASDPDEAAPHTGTRVIGLEEPKAALDEWRDRYGSKAEPDEYDPETIEAMRALGYIP